MKGLRGWGELARVMTVTVATMAFPRSARACDAPAIDAPSSIGEEVRRALDERADVDRCAAITIEPAAGGRLRIAVALPDGRTAMRTVARRSDVVPTLAGLLVIPPPPPPPTDDVGSVLDADPPARVGAPPPGLDPPLVRPPALSDSPAAPGVRPGAGAGSPPHPAVGVELDALAGVRVGDLTGVGVGLASFLELRGWLVGVQGRVDSYGDVFGEGDVVSAIEAAPLVGRRLDFGSVALDLVGGLGLMTTGSRVQEDVSPSGRQRIEEDAVDPRALASARLVLGARRATRFFLAVDASAGPVSDRATVPRPAAPMLGIPNNPAVPVATLGFAIGGALGTR